MSPPAAQRDTDSERALSERRLFTVSEANALLPDVRQSLDDLRTHVAALNRIRERLGGSPDASIGDESSDQLERPEPDTWVDPDHFQTVDEFHTTVGWFKEQAVQIKDLDRGLIDFPAQHRGRDILLCWLEGEDTVAWYHDLETGFAGRKPVSSLDPEVNDVADGD